MHACFVCSVAAPDGHGRDDCGRDFSPDPSKQGTTGTEVPPTKAADRTLGLALRWGRAPGALRLPGLRCLPSLSWVDFSPDPSTQRAIGTEVPPTRTSVEHLAWIEDPGRIEHVLDAAHPFDLGRAARARQVMLLDQPDAVLGRNAAADLGERRDQLAGDTLAL